MKKIDLAYLAGLFDGEGCISFSTSIYKPTGAKSHQILVTLGMTEEYFIRWLHVAYGGSVYTRKAPQKFPNARTLYVWRLLCQQACSFLIDIYPYLRLKRAQAEAAIKFGEFLKGRHHGKGRPRTDEERAVDEAYAILISNLNKGKKEVTTL